MRVKVCLLFALLLSGCDEPRTYTEQSLNDQFLLQPMDMIVSKFGAPDHTMMDPMTGEITSARYNPGRINIRTPAGTPCRVVFRGQAFRCVSITVKP